MKKEALLYENLPNESVACNLCHHHCVIRPGRRGNCKVRENRDGTLISLVYGKAASVGVDPIEKKPIFHCYPGSSSLSFATVGCNFHCSFCQNHSISQVKSSVIRGEEAAPWQLVETARSHGCLSISYTYTEPTIFFEYALDTAILAKAEGMHNIFVTNGYMTAEALDLLGGRLDCANVDLKAFRDETYRKVAGAQLQPVLDTLQRMKRAGVWVEVTTLVVPGLNDSDGELGDIAAFIAGSLGRETPWHVSRYHPSYRFDEAPPTPPQTIHRAVEIGLEAGLRYVYCGNLPGEDRESTYCWSCGGRLIHRAGFSVRRNRVTEDARCPDCGSPVDGIGMGESG